MRMHESHERLTATPWIKTYSEMVTLMTVLDAPSVILTSCTAGTCVVMHCQLEECRCVIMVFSTCID